MRSILLAILLVAVSGTSNAQEFSAGQVWQFETRPQDEGAVLTVLKTESLNGLDIVHVSISDLQIRIKTTPESVVPNIMHLPITRDALAGSVTELFVTVETLPVYQEGYDTWREAFDAGKAGVFSISLAECIEYMEQAMNGDHQ